MIHKITLKQTPGDLVELDRQFYYTVVTNGFLPGHGPSEYA